MIIGRAFYGIRCDRCEKDYLSASGYHDWVEDVDDVAAEAEDVGWLVKGKEHYCPECCCTYYRSFDQGTFLVPRPPIAKGVLRLKKLLPLMFNQDYCAYSEDDGNYFLRVYLHLDKQELTEGDKELIKMYLGKRAFIISYAKGKVEYAIEGNTHVIVTIPKHEREKNKTSIYDDGEE